MKINWLKLAVDILDDHKIKIIRSRPAGNDIFICWICVLCMAMKSRIPGLLVISESMAIGPEDLAVAAGVTLDTAKMALATFEQLGMVTPTPDGPILVTNFRDHQDIDAIEWRRAQGALRVARHRIKMRENQKQLESQMPANGNALQGSYERVGNANKTESKTENETEKKSKKKKSRSGATAPRAPATRIHVASPSETAYLANYIKRMGCPPPEPLTKVDVIHLNTMSKRHPDLFDTAIATFFADDFAASTSYSPGLFRKQFNRWAQGVQQNSKTRVPSDDENLELAREFIAEQGDKKKELTHEPQA